MIAKIRMVSTHFIKIHPMWVSRRWATCGVYGSYTSGALTRTLGFVPFIQPPHHHQHQSTPPHPRLLHSQSPLSLSNRATLSLPLSVKPTTPAPSRYLRGDNHGNSSTVGTGHQLTKIDSRKMEGKKERKGSLHSRRPVGMFVQRRSMRSSTETGTQAPSPLISSSNKRDAGLLERAH